MKKSISMEENESIFCSNTPGDLSIENTVFAFGFVDLDKQHRFDL